MTVLLGTDNSLANHTFRYWSGSSKVWCMYCYILSSFNCTSFSMTVKLPKKKVLPLIKNNDVFFVKHAAHQLANQ